MQNSLLARLSCKNVMYADDTSCSPVCGSLIKKTRCITVILKSSIHKHVSLVSFLCDIESSADKDQTPQNAVSDQALHYWLT